MNVIIPCDIEHDDSNPIHVALLEAGKEIERLRAIIQDIANAITDEGRKPGYHKQQVNYVRTMWNPLWQAISKAVKEMDNGTSKRTGGA